MLSQQIIENHSAPDELTPLLNINFLIKPKDNIDQTPYNLFRSDLQRSFTYIQDTLRKVKNFERKKIIQTTLIFSSCTVVLAVCYFAYIYGDIKFFKLKYPSLIDYENQHSNGTTCGKLFPIKNHVCDYTKPEKIPSEAPLALYCAEIFSRSQLPYILVYYNQFLQWNCIDYFPGINLANLIGIPAAI